MRGGHDALAHARGEPCGAHPAAHGKPIALKKQGETVAPQGDGVRCDPQTMTRASHRTYEPWHFGAVRRAAR